MSKARTKRPEFNDDDRKSLGGRLREAREYLGFSQEEVAKFLGISRSCNRTSKPVIERSRLSSQEARRPFQAHGRLLHWGGGGRRLVCSGREAPGGKAAALSAEDRAELGRFADFLRSRKQAKEG